MAGGGCFNTARHLNLNVCLSITLDSYTSQWCPELFINSWVVSSSKCTFYVLFGLGNATATIGRQHEVKVTLHLQHVGQVSLSFNIMLKESSSHHENKNWVVFFFFFNSKSCFRLDSQWWNPLSYPTLLALDCRGIVALVSAKFETLNQIMIFTNRVTSSLFLRLQNCLKMEKLNRILLHIQQKDNSQNVSFYFFWFMQHSAKKWIYSICLLNVTKSRSQQISEPNKSLRK